LAILKHSKSLSFVLLLLFSITAIASDDKDKKCKGTYLKIGVTEKIDVEEDLLIGSLRIEFEDQDPRMVQNRINKIMTKALARAKLEKAVLTSTEQYSVYKYAPNHDKNTKKQEIWRGSQSIKVQSTSSEDLLQLVGALQNMGLVVSSLNYGLSTTKIDSIRDSLMEVAIEKLLSKANRAAKALGKKDINVLDMNIDSQDFSPYSNNRSTLVSLDSTASYKVENPVMLPGQNQIALTISATILIKN